MGWLHHASDVTFRYIAEKNEKGEFEPMKVLEPTVPTAGDVVKEFLRWVWGIKR